MSFKMILRCGHRISLDALYNKETQNRILRAVIVLTKKHTALFLRTKRELDNGNGNGNGNISGGRETRAGVNSDSI